MSLMATIIAIYAVTLTVILGVFIYFEKKVCDE